jgi:hypothetical protein
VANKRYEDKPSRMGRRFRQMHQEATANKLDVIKMKQVLAEVALGGMNVQTVVFEPEELVIHVAYDKPPAAAGPYYRLDLNPWLKQEK